MFFNSLLFSHRIIRVKNGGFNNVVVNIPRNFWWTPIEAYFAIYDKDSNIHYQDVYKIEKNIKSLTFLQILNDEKVAIFLKYHGWFSTKYKMIEINLPPSMKPATNLSVKISKVY